MTASPPTRRQALALALAVACSRAARAADAADAAAPPGLRLRFAELAEARERLAEPDEWLLGSGPLQRAVLLGRRPPVDLASFQAWQAGAALAWDEAGRERWQAALAGIAAALERLPLRWPAEIVLLRTDGRESASQPHTRGTAIVLPQRFEQQGYSDGEVLAHELWHVLSRYQPALATRLYALIGYAPVAPLQWPLSWAPRRIVNQDAPANRHAMHLRLQGRQRTVMPVLLVADDAAPGQTLLDVMEPRLLEVQPGRGGAPTRAVLRRGEPVWWPIDAVPEFSERLGGNTDYTSHPDETIADNFMFLVSGRPVKNPALLQRIEGVLREAG